MEKQYSAQFFSLLLGSIQELCRTNLEFQRFAEVTGYISVELDNVNKERYVLNEIVKSSGHQVSDSFCTKTFMTQDENQMSQNLSQKKLQRESYCRNKNGMRHGLPAVAVESFNRHPERTYDFQRMNKEPTAEIDHRHSNQVPVPGNASYHRHRTNITDLESESNTNSDVIELDNDEDTDSATFEGSRIKENHAVRLGQVGTHSHSPVLKPYVRSRECVPSQLVTSSSVFTPWNLHDFDPPRFSSNQSHQLHVSSSERSPIFESEQDVQNIPNIQMASEATDIKSKVEGIEVPSTFLDDDDEVIDLDMFEDDLDDSSMTEDQCSPDIASETSLPLSACRVKNSGHNPSIRNVVKYAVNQFRKYNILKSGEDIDLFAVPPEKLDMLLCDFFKGVRKADGSEMNIRTLKNFQSHIDRYMREGGYPYSLVKDHRFQASRDWMKKNMKKLVEVGKVPVRHKPLSESEVDILFQSQQLGFHSPDSLINTMWFMNTKYFGIRCLSEHFNLKWGDVVLEQDPRGQEYIVCPLKTIQQYSPRVFPNAGNPSRCFVTCYKEYAALRPEGGLDGESYFYLSPQRHLQGDSWFVPEQLSWNKLSFLWKKMAASAGLPPDRKVRSDWNV